MSTAINWLADDSDDDYYVPPPSPLPQAKLSLQTSSTSTTSTASSTKTSTPSSTPRTHQRRTGGGNNNYNNNNVNDETPITTPRQGNNPHPTPQYQQQNGTPTINPARLQASQSDQQFTGRSQQSHYYKSRGPQGPQLPQFGLYYIGTQAKPPQVDEAIKEAEFSIIPEIKLVETPGYPQFIDHLKLTRYDYVFSLGFRSFEDLSTFFTFFLSKTVQFRLFFISTALESQYNSITPIPSQYLQSPPPPVVSVSKFHSTNVQNRTNNNNNDQQQQQTAPSSTPTETPIVSDSFISKSEVVQIRSRDDILRERAEKEAQERRARAEKQKARELRDKSNKTAEDLAKEKLSQREPTVLDADLVASWRNGKNQGDNKDQRPARNNNNNSTRGGRGGKPQRDNGPKHGHEFSSDSEDETAAVQPRGNTNHRRDGYKGRNNNNNTTNDNNNNDENKDQKDDNTATKDTRGGTSSSYGRGRGRGALGVGSGNRRGSQSGQGSQQNSKYNSRRGSQQQDADDLTQKMAEVSLEEGANNNNNKGNRRSYNKNEDAEVNKTSRPTNKRQSHNQGDSTLPNTSTMSTIATQVSNPKSGERKGPKKVVDEKEKMYAAIEKLMAQEEKGEKIVTFNPSVKNKDGKDKKTAMSKSMSQNSFSALFDDDE